MKAIVLKEKQNIQMEDRPIPSFGPDDALVKVAYCGICGSDLHAYNSGELYLPGTIMGHEFSGTIAEVGDNVVGFKKGEHVVVIPGLPGEKPIGLDPETGGGFSEYVKVTNPYNNLKKLFDNISLEEAALCEPFSIALHAVRLSNFKLGDRVIVIGAGPIGLAVINMLQMGGAGKITVVEKSPKRIGAAINFNVDEVLNPDEEGLGLREKVFQDLMGPDIVFECAGVPATFAMATNLIKSSGQVILVGIIEQETTFHPLGIAVGEIDIKGSFGATEEEFQYVINFLHKGRLKTNQMISEVIPLESIEEKGFKVLLTSPDKIKILVKP